MVSLLVSRLLPFFDFFSTWNVLTPALITVFSFTKSRSTLFNLSETLNRAENYNFFNLFALWKFFCTCRLGTFSVFFLRLCNNILSRLYTKSVPVQQRTGPGLETEKEQGSGPKPCFWQTSTIYTSSMKLILSLIWASWTNQAVTVILGTGVT